MTRNEDGVTNRSPRGRLALLEAAVQVTSAAKPVDEVPADDICVVLFAALDGSHQYLKRRELQSFAAFIAAFAERHAPALQVLSAVAEYDNNADHVVAAALFGLGVTRAEAGQELFARVLGVPSIDPYDKLKAVKNILTQSPVGLSQLPSDYWRLMTRDRWGREILEHSERHQLGNLTKDTELCAAEVPEKVSEVLRTQQYLKAAYYRGYFRGRNFENHIDKKRYRIAQFAAEIRAAPA